MNKEIKKIKRKCKLQKKKNEQNKKDEHNLKLQKINGNENKIK
jgi:hypothetical protein